MIKTKFRAWNKEDKRWIDPVIDLVAIDMFSGDLYYDCRCVGADAFYVPKKDIINLQQYTGLKDINSNEIYEGDIVKNQYRDQIYVIEWDNEITGFTQRCGTHTTHFFMDWTKDKNTKYNIEIIGNIYDNPELLEKCSC